MPHVAHGRERQLGSLGKALRQVSGDWALGDVGATQVAAGDAPDVVPELRGQRIVEVQLGPQARDRGRVGALSHHGRDGIAWRDVQEQERDDEHTAQGGKCH